jgi:hypothetical protein
LVSAGGQVREVQVAKAPLNVLDRGGKVDFVPIVVEREDMDRVGKMVEDEVHVPDDKLRFGDGKGIGLFLEVNGVAAGAELIPKVAYARPGKRYSVGRKDVLGGNLHEGLEDIAAQERLIASIYRIMNPLPILPNPEGLRREDDGISVPSMSEGRGLQDRPSAQFLREGKGRISLARDRRGQRVRTLDIH